MRFWTEGKPTGQYEYNGADRALDLVGRHLGMFIDRSEAHVTHHQDDPLDDASLDDLCLLLAELQAQKARLQANVIEGEMRAIE